MRIPNVVLMMLALIVAGCSASVPEAFTITLVQNDMATSEFQAAELATLELKNQPLLTADDIIAYESATHEILLTAGAFERLQDTFTTPVDVDGLPFVVSVGAERIYGGALWTPLSSLTFDGVIILQPFVAEPPVIRLDVGYPSPGVFTGADPRADERIMNALALLGKLGSVEH